MTENQVDQQVSYPGVLQDMVLESSDISDFLDGLVKLAADTLSSENNDVLCGVVLLRPRTKGTVTSSSEQARLMDEIQYPFDDGPCLRAAREGQVHVVGDFRQDDAFGGYSEAIANHGIRSAPAYRSHSTDSPQPP